MQHKVTAPHIVSVAAPAKINLCFAILARREDNYHEIRTLFQALDLADKLIFKFWKEEGYQKEFKDPKITLVNKNDSIESGQFPTDSSNSIAQSIKIFLARLANYSPVVIEVEIEKNIPIGAGLAGGSTDAAATLLALNDYFDKPFTESILIELAAQIGSDVAFCLIGGLAVGRGRGEQLEKTNLNLGYYFILVKLRSISVSTPWAYRMYDQFITSASVQESSPDSVSHALLSLQYESDINKHAKLFWNAFEPVIFKEYPVLAKVKNLLIEFGCLTAHLTGSGPTIFGLVKDQKTGERVLAAIKNLQRLDDQPIEIDAWLTRCINYGAKILSH